MKVSEAESRIMEALWRGKPLTREEIFEKVGPANSWAPGTVKTLVTRLLRKKAITGAKEDRGHVYRPLLSRDDYLREESAGFLKRLFKGEVAPLVSHLADHRALTAKDLAKLKKLIAELEEKDG